MTKEEAIRALTHMKYNLPYGHKALDMAIEALSQPIVAKRFDIQSGHIYCSPQIAENVKVVVRCKDCKYRCTYKGLHGENFFGCQISVIEENDANDFCSYGERKET